MRPLIPGEVCSFREALRSFPVCGEDWVGGDLKVADGTMCGGAGVEQGGGGGWTQCIFLCL